MPEGCQYLLLPVKSLPESCQQPMAHLQEGCANYKQRGNLGETPLKKVNFKVKNKEATDNSKNCQRFISK
jgi:hypothetical protein